MIKPQELRPILPKKMRREKKKKRSWFFAFPLRMSLSLSPSKTHIFHEEEEERKSLNKLEILWKLNWACSKIEIWNYYKKLIFVYWNYPETSWKRHIFSLKYDRCRNSYISRGKRHTNLSWQELRYFINLILKIN